MASYSEIYKQLFSREQKGDTVELFLLQRDLQSNKWPGRAGAGAGGGAGAGTDWGNVQSIEQL